MSQLSIFTGERQTGQTSRLVDAIIEKSKTHIVVCFAHNSAMAKELFAKLRLKVGLDDGIEIPNINVMNTGYSDFFANAEKYTARLISHNVMVALDDVPLDRLAWLTEWSASTGVQILASFSSDVEFKTSLSQQKVGLSTDQLLQQLNVSTTSSYHALVVMLNNVAIKQSFVVVNVEDCALTLNIADPRKSDHVFAAKSKLTPGVKFEVIRLTETTWHLGPAKEQ